MPQLPNIEPIEKRQAELDHEIAQPDFYSDARRAADLSREHQKLGRVLDLVQEYQDSEQALKENQAMVADAGEDEELREMASEEIAPLEEKMTQLYNDILVAMIPPDPSDSRNTIIEIRAGTGGDEAALFAGDLFRMYTRYTENRNWKIELMGSNDSEAGGYKEVSFLVTGDEVYRSLKFESGVHRVQRVPATEAGGRIHTSAATVAVLPEAEEVDVKIDPADLDISVARASGPGGQGVNTTDSAVQILHKPTGLIVKCADERSQLKNKQKAMKVLRSRLLEQRQREEHEKYAATRKNQVGSGDRSERIRTYNFPQGRISDHRINLTLYNLNEVLEGSLDSVIKPLLEADEQAKIDNLMDINPER